MFSETAYECRQIGKRHAQHGFPLEARYYWGWEQRVAYREGYEEEIKNSQTVSK
jgi:hypothetical protein